MTDYYGVLSLNKSSSVADVTASFRKLALKVTLSLCTLSVSVLGCDTRVQHHPDRNPDDMTTAQRKLDEICEAYEVLSNREPSAQLRETPNWMVPQPCTEQCMISTGPAG